MSEKSLHKLIEDVGYIRGKVDGMETHLKEQNGTVKDLVSRVSKHDVIFGKMGVAVTAFVFVFTVSIDFVKEWVKSRYF